MEYKVKYSKKTPHRILDLEKEGEARRKERTKKDEKTVGKRVGGMESDDIYIYIYIYIWR